MTMWTLCVVLTLDMQRGCISTWPTLDQCDEAKAEWMGLAIAWNWRVRLDHIGSMAMCLPDVPLTRP